MNNLKNAFVIGQQNFDSWSVDFKASAEGYLKVLPHPDEKIAFKNPFKDWQDGKPEGTTYYSSWGADKELEVTLNMSDLTQVTIDGFGLLKSGDGKIPWLGDKATPYEILRGYNGLIPGPMLITEPGDTLKIKLNNNLAPGQTSNLHTHGLHVSPMGNGDNVLAPLEPGEIREIEIEIPKDHIIGTDWYHPHLHGLTNEQVASGLGALLIVNPPHDIPDLNKWDVTKAPIHYMAINSFGVQQINRPGKEGDPLNQDTTKAIPAGTPLEVKDENSQKVYTLSDAPFIGYNAKPVFYNPQLPTGGVDAQGNPSLSYGSGGLAEPVENVIHTVNGQYNPTLELKTGEWNQFSLANFSVNSFHVIQLVKEEADGSLTVKKVNLVAIDGDSSGIVEGTRREITEFPVLNPGARASIQNWFEEPGKYYLLSNATEEILGDKAPLLTKQKGFDDGHLIWGSQVLATIEVTGNVIPTGAFPEPYNVLKEHNQETHELIDYVKKNGADKERTFTWYANPGGAILKNKGQFPEDTEVKTFEGTYTINGEYLSTESGAKQVPLAMPMLGTKEIWNVVNTSGKTNPDIAAINPKIDIPLTEWHPFHIHQNDFTVLEINGIPTEQIKQNYLSGVLSDTIALSPTYKPGSVTPENPYGEAQINGTPSETKILMEFKDFPGSYVNHCHILFHEDAGMMALVRVILNTEDTWLGAGANNGKTIELLKASDISQRIYFNPYKNFKGEVDFAIADINHKKSLDNNNVTDNVTDVVTIQRSLDGSADKFTVKVFDGATLFDEQKQGKKELDNENTASLIKEFNPFQGIALSPERKASVASGDINGDGLADIVVGIGGGIASQVEVYSGKDYQLITRIDGFHHEDFKGGINLAVGDANGDNYDDIIIGQGRGGKGLVEIYSGIEIDKLIRENPTNALNGRMTSHDASLLTEKFQPYGDSYTGEVEVTSGYILQTPEKPNGASVQTSNANITTLAVDAVAEGQKKVKIHTYLGGHHGSDSHATHDATSAKKEQFRLDKEFTPDGDIQTLSGSFSDIAGGQRGEGVLFANQKDGNYQLINLKEKNETESIIVKSMAPAITPPPTALTKVNDKGIFSINSASNKTKLKISISQHNSQIVHELGVFAVDDAEGRINGVAPSEANYTRLALERGKVAFSALGNVPNGFTIEDVGRLLEFNSGANLRFYAIRNSTTDAVISGQTSTNEVLFSDASTLQVTGMENGEYSLALKNNSNNPGGTDLSELVVKIKAVDDVLPLGVSMQGNPHGELLDFRGITNKVKADFTVNREAAYDNIIGFYKVANERGDIDTNGDGTADVLVGSEGYIQAAIRGRLSGIELKVDNQGTANYTGTFDSNSMFAPFIIVNGTPEVLLDNDLNNNPEVYFPFLGANPGKVDHVRLLGNNTFGFEDLVMGGDLDCNDITVKAKFTLM